MLLHEKTRAAAAPRKPKNGAVSSPLNTEEEDIFFFPFFLGYVFDLGKFGKLIGNCSLLERERVWEIVYFVLFLFLVVELELGGRKGSFGVAFLIMGCTVLTVLSTTGGCAENFSPKFKSMKQTGLDSLNLD